MKDISSVTVLRFIAGVPRQWTRQRQTQNVVGLKLFESKLYFAAFITNIENRFYVSLLIFFRFVVFEISQKIKDNISKVAYLLFIIIYF